MRPVTKDRLVRVLFVVGLIGAVVMIPVGLISSSPSPTSYYLQIMLGVAVASYFVLGALIVRRQPGNTIGWLFFALAYSVEVWILTSAYAIYGVALHPGSLPGTTIVGWIGHWSAVPLFVLFIPIFLLFPDGHLLSPRWRPVLWIWAVGSSIAVVGFALSQVAFTIGDGLCPPRPGDIVACLHNPIVLRGLGSTIEAVTGVAGFLTFFTAPATLVAVVLRFRRARGEERQQIKLVSFVGIAFFLSFFLFLLPFGNPSADSDLAWVATLGFVLTSSILVLGLPIACGVAILKYRLYDADVVIRKTVVFTLVAGALLALYLAVLGLATVGRLSRIAVGAVLLAVTFNPVRRAARSIANRLVYGRRASAYEVLSEFSGRVGEAYANEDVLQRMASILADGTTATSARVLLRVAGDLREVAAVGEPGADEHLVPVIHQGEELGALAVTMPANDPLDPARERLVHDLASQAGLVLRNARLIEELRASRQRLVAAQDAERRKLERNIHDGAQQQLVALTVNQRLAAGLVAKDPERAVAMLEQLQADSNQVLEDLRDLARGIYPPLLADKGLVAALESQARKAAVPTTVESDGLGRYPQDLEAAVYFCTLEALNNIAKYAEAKSARVRLAANDGHLVFEVADDGRGFDTENTGYGTGLQGMADRLDAIGGSLAVRSALGDGTTVTGQIPTKNTA
ncbi:MAG: GAF domain-containing sensor histidine kinase [Actinomycetota bacterium]